MERASYMRMAKKYIKIVGIYQQFSSYFSIIQFEIIKKTTEHKYKYTHMVGFQHFYPIVILWVFFLNRVRKYKREMTEEEKEKNVYIGKKLQ